MGVVSGCIRKRDIVIELTDDERQRYGSVIRDNSLDSLNKLCKYYEGKGLVIDYTYPGRWPVNGSTSLMIEYLLCKQTYTETIGG